MRSANIRGLFISLCLGIIALNTTPQNAMAQNSKQAEFNAEYQRAAGLTEYASDEISAGNEDYQKAYYGAACTRFTNGLQALVKALNIYEVMLLSANMSPNARSHISELARALRETTGKLNTRREDVCSRG